MIVPSRGNEESVVLPELEIESQVLRIRGG
ncbi:hypothetical protein HG15A2_27900 [Adhaeretor mobilis]|uniref:Uncharacterized protein n=1 Tax=Adhaeretor mobilis TaxID=1930276 RepID=A0A517MXD1_9BACT|nr:hypothetical protein HG15A2_27900 [Adhaeretor mobilis]